jgi:UDP-N-acetylglucosamine 4-epimerase
LAATTRNADAINQIYNVAVGEGTSLNQLFQMIRSKISSHNPDVAGIEPVYQDFRHGDVRHSLADISKIEKNLGYAPTFRASDALGHVVNWYLERL